MSNFFQELKRRNVVRLAVAYLVLGWPGFFHLLSEDDFAYE